MQLTGLLNAGQALFSYPTYLEVSQRCDSFWMFFGQKNGVRKNSIRLRRLLVGGFNPFEKYWSKRESSPNKDENKKYLKPPPSLVFIFEGVLFFLFGRGKVFPKNWIDMSYV